MNTISTQYRIDPAQGSAVTPVKPGTEVAKGNEKDQVKGGAPLSSLVEAKKAEEPKDIQEDLLNDVVKEMNQHVQNYRRELQFLVDKDADKTVVKVVDMDTDEVIRQFPPESILELSKKMSEINGNIFNTEA
jgi:flagellar protein FlaG